tara:strand:- start:559 stop:2544 length:1986 start_codon:yes stop_codon:yes gene_type:complete
MANEFRVKNGIVAIETSSSAGNLTIVDGEIDSDQGILLDAVTDITLDAAGDDVILKDSGTEFGRFTNNSGQLQIATSSSSTAAINLAAGGHVATTGNLTVGGDLAVTGDITTTVFADNIAAGDSASNLVTSSGNVTIDSQAGHTIVDGHSSIQLQFGNGGIVHMLNANSGDAVIQQKVDGKDFVFKTHADTEVLRIHDDATSGGGMKLSSAAASKPVFLIENTANDATGGQITFNVNRGADAADNDVLGTFLFSGLDDGTPEAQDYAKIFADVLDATHTQEKGRLTMQVATYAGNMTTGLVVQGTTGDGVVNVTLGAGTTSTTTVVGDLIVQGTQTQINSTSLLVEDAIIELGLVDGSVPSSDTAIDFGMIANYHDGSQARKSAFFWDESHQGWSVANIVSESSQVLTPSNDDIDFHWLYDDNNYARLQVAADGVTTISTNDSDGELAHLTFDVDGDIIFNTDGTDILFKDASVDFGSITHSAGVMRITSAADKDMELRADRNIYFFVDTDAGDTSSSFTFETKDPTGPDTSNVDNEKQPVIVNYKSNGTALGQVQFGYVKASSNSAGVLFTYDGAAFGVAEVTIHTINQENTLHQANKMLICADTTGTDELNFSNYSILYSDGSTEIATFSATIASDGTVSVNVDGDDNDDFYYAVTFLK